MGSTANHMHSFTALKWAVYYRALALCAAFLGLAIAGVATVIGAGELVDAVMGPGDPLEAISIATFALPAIGYVLAVVVWQVGKTAAFYKTIAEATGAEVDGGVDEMRLKSEIVAVVDQRLAEIHAETSATREALGVDEPEVDYDRYDTSEPESEPEEPAVEGEPDEIGEELPSEEPLEQDLESEGEHADEDETAPEEHPETR